MFRVKIETDNAAFQGEYGGDDVETTAQADETREELARILRQLARDLDNGADAYVLRDINGNTVGTAGFGR